MSTTINFNNSTPAAPSGYVNVTFQSSGGNVSANVPTAAGSLGFTPMNPANNLSDVANAATSRTNLGLGTAATHAATDFDTAGAASTALTSANTFTTSSITSLGLGTASIKAISFFLQTANNLSDVANAATARTNLGLGTAAQQSNSFFLQTANNLSDVTASTARTNLGLGTAATYNAGTAFGVATLDGSGKLNTSQIPSSLVGAVVYQGTWNANTNSPTLASGTGTKGYYYKVSTAGTTTIDGISSWNVGDTIIFDGTTWDKIDGVNPEVQSVFGRTGVVTAQTGDYTAAQVGLGNVVNSLQLVASNNLSDLTSVSSARTNLGLGTAAVQSTSYFLQSANNLSDLGSISTARTNLGLTSAATATPSSLTETGSSVLTITGGSAALLSATSIQVQKATASVPGYLAAADFTTFAAKQAAISSITIPAHNFLNSWNGTTLGYAQPAFTDISGTATAAQLPSTVVNAITNDTNVTGSITAQNLTLGWTGTLAAGRLNANVVQSVTNDTNFTGSISAQTLALGFTGTLAAGRLNSNVVQSVVNDTNFTGSISAQALTLGFTGTLAAGRLNANVVQAITNDTNVTGSITSQNLSLGWTGQLAVSRGGTGLNSTSQNFVFAGPTSGSGAPTWRALAAGDIPSLSATYAALAATSNTFTGYMVVQGASGFNLTNPTAATSSNNYVSPATAWNSTYWNGSASATDQWYIQPTLGTGANPTSTLTLAHTGSSGAATFSVSSASSFTGAATFSGLITSNIGGGGAASSFLIATGLSLDAQWSNYAALRAGLKVSSGTVQYNTASTNPVSSFEQVGGIFNFNTGTSTGVGNTASLTTQLALSSSALTVTPATTFSSTIAVTGNAGLSTTARTQLSIGTYLDIYSANSASGSATVASIRADNNNSVYINGSGGGGGVYFNYDHGGAGVSFCGGTSTVVASISGAGLGTFNGITSNGANGARQTLGTFAQASQATFLIQGQWGGADLGSASGTMLTSSGTVGLRSGTSGNAQVCLFSTGNLAIGSTTDGGQTLQVTGNTNVALTTSSVSQQAAIGITNVCSNAAAGYGVAARVTTSGATTNPLLTVFYGQILTATGAGTTTSANGLYVDSPSLASGSTVTTAYGINLQPQFVSGKTGTAYGIYQSGTSDLNVFKGQTTFNNTVLVQSPVLSTGATFEVLGTISGTGNNYCYNMYSGLTVAASATLTGTANSFFSALTLGASASVAGAVGLNIFAPSLGSGATITTNYGVLINAQNATGITTSYGIYQSGSSDQNYFAGKMTGNMGGRQSWTPTISASGAMTITSVTITNATYLQIGPLVWFEIEFFGTLGGTLNQVVTSTLPITAATIGGRTPVFGVFSYADTSHWQGCYSVINNGGNTMGWVVNGGANFSTAGVTYFSASGFYSTI